MRLRTKRRLVAGFPSSGLVGLAAVDYPVDDRNLEGTGHVRIDGLPSITPFARGRPRRPSGRTPRPTIAEWGA